jgi:anti-anti-sigma factor
MSIIEPAATVRFGRRSTRLGGRMGLLDIVPTELPGTFRLVGELDISNVKQVQARLEEELRLGPQLTLDMSELSFMDSQGLRMLIVLGEQAAANRSAISILNCSKVVQRVLDISVPKGIPGVKVLKPDI